jgi:hypothetical protein
MYETKKIQEKNAFRKLRKLAEFYATLRVLKEKFLGSRPAGLGGDRQQTNSSKRLS